jgi:hypothetical protein
MLSSMETQSAASRRWVTEDPSMPSEPAYEDSWYRVLKRLSDEGVPDGPDSGGDEGETL